MDFEAIKAAAQGYQADMTRFLREMISHPSESCEEKDVVHCIKAEMEKLGFKAYIPEEMQGPIITTFFYPENCKYTFAQMYAYIKSQGYAIYPGKVTEAETFRIGNIGEIYPEDIQRVCGLIREFIETQQ